MRMLAIAAALLALSSGAYAQGHNHGADRKGPHGGPMQDVYDEAGKSVPAAGYSGSVLVGSGQGRQVVQLAPGDGNTLSGTTAAAVARGAPITLQLEAPGGKTGQARF